MSTERSQPDSDRQGSVLDLIERLTGAAPRVDLRREDASRPVAEAEMAMRAAPHGRGDYRLIGEIARGGMGVVLRGRDQDLRRDVAIKVLHDDLARRPDSVQRFVEEAQICGQLQHPGIVPVYELGLLADQRPYFTMKLIRGRTFADLLLEREESTSDRRRMLEIFLSVCQAMAYVHSRGVIHRDLKPANVMVGAFGEVQVVDWGLAKLLARDSSNSAASATPSALDRAQLEPVEVDARDSRSLYGAVMGTLSYMPPEQARGEVESLDERADVFALGAMLCEILTGDPPYSKSTTRAAVEAARGLLQPAFESLDAASADRELVQLCKQCLALEREHRPRNAKVVVERLQAHFEGVEKSARSAQIEAAEARVRAAEERRARKLSVGLAVSVVITLLVGGGGWAWTREQRLALERSTDEEVEVALSLAASAQGAGDWERAAAAVARARSAAHAGSASRGATARLATLEAQIQHGADAARAERERMEQNAALLAKLDVVTALDSRGSSERADFERRDKAFVEAFRAWGMDIDGGDPAALVERIVASGVAVEICRSIDQWSWSRAAVARGWNPSARRLAELASAADPDEGRNAIRKALLERDELRLMTIAEAARDAPSEPHTSVALAEGLLGFRRLDDARGVLEAAVERHPSDFSLHFTLGFVLEDLGQEWHDAARAHYTAALALRPRSANVLRGLAGLSHAAGDVENAVRLYREGLELSPDSFRIWNDLATALEDPLEQEACLRRCLELAPDSFEALTNLGRLLHMTDRAREAVPVLREATRLAPWSYLSWGHLGTALARTGDSDGAIEALGKALELNAEDVPSLHNLAVEYRSQGRLEEALAASARALELAPRHPLLLTGLGVTLSWLGREADAIEQLRGALESNSDLDGARSLLARLLANATEESLREPREALELARLERVANPADSEAALAVALALLRSEEWEAALAASAARPDLDPSLAPSMQAVRALALLALGRRDEARATQDALRDAPAPAADPFARREREQLLDELRRALDS